MRPARSIRATLLLLLAAAPAAWAAELVVQQLRCRGEEPFWGLDAGPETALWSEPGKELRFSGGFGHLGRAAPGWITWHGTEARPGRRAASLVLTARKESCTPTMGEGDNVASLDWRAVIVRADGSAVTGCCSARSGLDLAAAPVAKAAAKPTEDWSHYLGALLPAIEACLRDGVPSTERVGKAWPMNHGKAGVRLVDAEGTAYDCVADIGARRVETVERVSPGDSLPGVGNPVFWPAREAPPMLQCGRVERVVDRRGRTAGHLNYDPC
jgi:uncharacterized membrane protein